jgi:hypothetical protein
MTRPKDTHQARNNRQIAIERERAITQLRLYDIRLSAVAKTERVIAAIGRAGFVREEDESTLAYLRRFLATPTGRKLVPPRTPVVWRGTEYRPAPHPRQAEIDALPRPIPGGCVGNGFIMGRESRD